MAPKVYLVSAVLVLAVGSARAENEPPQQAGDLIKQAAAAYTALDYDKALPILSSAEKLPGLATEDRVNVLKYRAFIFINEGKDILAHDTVEDIFALQQDFELPATVSPKLRGFFADVKKEWQSKHKDRIVVAKPATAGPSTVEQPLSVRATQQPNFFVRFWPSLTCFAAGVALLVPGTIIGLDAASGSETLKNAPKDETGRMKSMTLKEAQALQDEADTKGLTADILLGVGAAAMVTGVVMFFVYDGANQVSATKSTSISFQVDGSTRLLRAAWVY